jgi:hypothetical protein
MRLAALTPEIQTNQRGMRVFQVLKTIVGRRYFRGPFRSFPRIVPRARNDALHSAAFRSSRRKCRTWHVWRRANEAVVCYADAE